MIPIALVGNCQASALGAVLRRSTVVECIQVLDVNGRGSDHFANTVFAIYGKTGIEYVLSHPMGDDFDDLSSKRLKAHYQGKFGKYSNIYFAGLHPDLTYFGGFGHRVTGPLGDYHSRIVLAAFIQGLSAEQCRLAFNYKVYEKLGYFLQFKNSLDELFRRDEGNLVKFASRFAELTHTTLTMLSVNHPTLETVVELARLIEGAFTDKRSVLAPSVCTYPLGKGPVWPIYPEIRDYNKLPYETPFDFYPAEGSGAALSVDEFVMASYASYEKQGRDVLVAVDSAKSFANLPIR